MKLIILFFLEANQNLSEAQTVIKTSDMESRHCRNVLRQKESETQSNDAAYNKDKNLFDNLSSDIQNLCKKIDNIEYADGDFEKLQENKRMIQNEIKKQQLQLERLNAYRYVLQYRDPEPGFDRSKVHGMVGKLFNVIDDYHCLALMITAGGSVSIYSLVIF